MKKAFKVIGVVTLVGAIIAGIAAFVGFSDCCDYLDE